MRKLSNIIYEKIKSHFKINPQDFDLNINHYKNQKNEYLESLEIANIIKETLRKHQKKQFGNSNS